LSRLLLGLYLHRKDHDEWDYLEPIEDAHFCWKLCSLPLQLRTPNRLANRLKGFAVVVLHVKLSFI
jgi:hypothetical protein